MDEITKRNIEAYNTSVDNYFENTKNLELPEMRIREEFLSLIKTGKRIIDIGCGPGRDAKIFSDKWFKVTGIDLAEKVLTKAKEVAPKADFKLMDFMHLDFSDNLFDGIWFNAGLLVIEKKYAPQLLLNIFRILKANGILFVSVKEGKGEGLAVDKRYNLEKFYAYYSKSELKETLEKSGFIVLKIDMPNLNSSYHAHKWIIYLCKKPI